MIDEIIPQKINKGLGQLKINLVLSLVDTEPNTVLIISTRPPQPFRLEQDDGLARHRIRPIAGLNFGEQTSKSGTVSHPVMACKGIKPSISIYSALWKQANQPLKYILATPFTNI